MGKLQYIAKADTNSGGTSSAITFNSIPQTYTDLYFICVMKSQQSAGNVNSSIIYNNTTSSYSNQFVQQTSGSIGQSGSTGNSAYSPIINGTAAQSTSCFSNTMIFIPNYSRTDRSKGTIILSGTNFNSALQLAYTQFYVSSWVVNDAITRIDLNAPTAWDQYCTFYLYGISRT